MNDVTYPILRQVVLDCTDARALAEFYRELLGLRYRPGDEPPAPGEPDTSGQDWLVLRAAGAGALLAFQQVATLPQATWPEGPVPQQLHLDMTVPNAEELTAQHARALALGARLLLDRFDDPRNRCTSTRIRPGIPFASSWRSRGLVEMPMIDETTPRAVVANFSGINRETQGATGVNAVLAPRNAAIARRAMRTAIRSWNRIRVHAPVPLASHSSPLPGISATMASIMMQTHVARRRTTA